MPELPEVETVRRGLLPMLEGRRIWIETRRPDLRFPLPPDLALRCAGRTVLGIDRRAKYLMIRLEGDLVLMLHLGMSGRIAMVPTDHPLGPHDHVIIDTDDDRRIVFHDPRRFGMLDLVETGALPMHRLIRHLGYEPLDPAFDGAALDRLLAGKRCSIKAAIMDQRLVVGVGNIYACEALFRARISPKRSAASVVGVRASRLVPAIKAVLSDAIAAGGSSLRDYVQASGELGYFQHRFAVYGRAGQPCPACDCGQPEGVRRIIQQGRSTFYCPTRQR